MFSLKSTVCAAALLATATCNCLSAAATLLDTANFNVTLNLAPAHSLTVSDLTFGTINPSILDPTSNPITSTSGSVRAYSNDASGHYVQVVASDPKYLSEDGNSFLMLGQTSGNADSIPFYLQTSTLQDGSPAPAGVRDILPGYITISVDGSDSNHVQSRDLWAILRSNADVQNVAADAYLAVLTLNHYSNQ